MEQILEMLQQDAAETGLADFRLAREEFHRLTGEFEEGEPWFETRMTMFMDWYLLDRKGPDDLTPNERFLNKRGAELSPTDKKQFELLNVTLRSIFQIEKKNGSDLLVEDLLSGGQWKARWTLPSVGLALDDIFNSRLFMIDGKLEIGRSAVLHPVDAHDAIFDIVDRAQKENMPARQMVYYLDKVKLKLDRYSNVKIRHVYKYPTDVVF
ncbi:MAG: hypothetical protein JXX29_08305 [Deltaproteobacteria bacterium]|nr:hypothetical protein [Deltaproteobacteria bacterium]